MNRKIKPTKRHYQLKDEQVNLLLEDIEKNFRGIQTNSRNKGQTASSSKKILQGAKSSHKALRKKNKQSKEYIVKIKQQYKQQQQQQQEQQQ